MMNIEEILFKLDDFCNANKIEYVVTGTVALFLLGVPSSYIPQDVDIKVFNLTKEQKEKFEELQFLSGLKNSEYKTNSCFSFYINGAKINVIIENDECACCDSNIAISLIDRSKSVRRLIWAHRVDSALGAKMKLNREKDKAYMLNLIQHLTLLTIF